MPSAAFPCILKRFLAIGSDPEIDALNDGAKFSTRGGLGNGKILIKPGETDITNVGKQKQETYVTVPRQTVPRFWEFAWFLNIQ